MEEFIRERREAWLKDRERIYTLALHDVRRMIDRFGPDDLLISHIYRRLAKAVAEVYDANDPFEERGG